MSERKAAFAERTIRSLKNILYRYGYKYIHKLPPFIATMNSRNNRSIDMKPNHVKNSDFVSILYSKLLSEYKNPKFGLEIEFAFPSMIYFSVKVINHNLHKTFLKLLQFLLKKPPIYTIKDEQEEVISGKFYEKELIRVF